MSCWERTKNYTATGFKAFSEAVLEYDTPKIVHIKNKKVGLLNRLVQLIIIGYIVGFAIVIEQGYNEFEDVLSAVTTKVQGLGYTNGTGWFENAGNRVWDSSDYVQPPQSPNSVFIMTNMWVTNQTQGLCPDSSYKACNNDTHTCNATFNTGNGILTGECNTNITINGSHYCNAYAWCPVEREDKTVTNQGPKLLNAGDFTIFIKNSIQFPRLAPKFRRRNVAEGLKDGCRFDFKSEKNYLCPIISLQQIVDMLEHPYNLSKDLATNGAVLGLQIEWNCDLNRSPEHCIPRYSARRLDDPNAVFSGGLNFRFTTNWILPNGTLARQLIKAYGIRINILVTGQGGKFSFTNLILTIGSGIALLALATVVSDVFILYVLRQRSYYRRKKYQNVEGGASLSFFRDDAVMINPKEIPPTENDPLLTSPQTDGETSDDGSMTVTKKRNHGYTKLS